MISMKNSIFFIIFIICSLCTEAQVPHKNHQIFGINKEDPHPLLFSYTNKVQALKNAKEDSPFFKSLDGIWKFNWVIKPSLSPENFYKTNYDDSKWDNFPVPGNWEVHGYDYPIYLDEKYPFDTKWPDVSEDYNPVGVYRKTIQVDKSWLSRDIFIHFGAAKSALYLYINGEMVGFSQGSKTPAEFEISSFLKAGKNLIAFKIYRWSDASYIESQDMLRLSGVERSVYLYAKPKTHIHDVFSIVERMPENDSDWKMELNSASKVRLH